MAVATSKCLRLIVVVFLSSTRLLLDVTAGPRHWCQLDSYNKHILSQLHGWGTWCCRYGITALFPSFSPVFSCVKKKEIDPMFRGIYHGKQAHQSDFEDVLKRAFDIGLQKIIVTGGSLSDSKEAVKVASTNDQLFSTVGCHPTRCGEFEHTPDTTPQQYLDQLLKLAKENKGKVAAIGECGLDFDRLHFCPKELQLKYFEEQLLLSEKTGLPLFLHCRNAFSNFIDILQRNKCKINGGVMHSFDGTREEALTATDFGLYIGINGCSLKTEENLKVARALPVERILIETDAPWCEIRPSHASATFVATQFLSKKKERWEEGIGVKGRNEPRNIIQVLEVVASLHNMDKIDLSEQIYRNTCNLFNWTT